MGGLVGGLGGSWTLLGSTKLGSAATNITFSSIPQTGKALAASIRARGDAAIATDSLAAQFSGNATNYGSIRQDNTGATITPTVWGPSQTSALLGLFPAANTGGNANFQGNGFLWLPSYADTTKSKGGICIAGDGLAISTIYQIMWQLTTAITSIKFFFFNSTNLVTGSEIDLWMIS